jgi:hypothetical protein
MRLINNPIVAILILAGFIALADYSLGSSRSHSDGSYDAKQVKKLNTLVSTSLRPANRIYTPSQRHAVMQLWHLSESDVAKPVDIFGE